MPLFATALLVHHRGGGVRFCSGAIVARDEATAVHETLKSGRERFPQAEGWGDHQVSAVVIPTDMLVKALNGVRGN